MATCTVAGKLSPRRAEAGSMRYLIKTAGPADARRTMRVSPVNDGTSIQEQCSASATRDTSRRGSRLTRPPSLETLQLSVMEQSAAVSLGAIVTGKGLPTTRCPLDVAAVYRWLSEISLYPIQLISSYGVERLAAP